MSDWRCPGCHAENASGAAVCEMCGRRRAASSGGQIESPARCPFDGSPLMANGWCEAGNGYPITRAVCPFVCDVCRQPLTWAGTCNTCAAYAPGDRYEYEAPGKPGGGHWVLVEKGPLVIFDRQQQAHMAAEFGARMERLVARMRVA